MSNSNMFANTPVFTLQEKESAEESYCAFAELITEKKFCRSVGLYWLLIARK